MSPIQRVCPPFKENDPAVATVLTGWAVSALGQWLTSQRPIELVCFVPLADIAADERQVNDACREGFKEVATFGLHLR